MTHTPPSDPVLYLAAVNAWAKDAQYAAQGYEPGTLGHRQARDERRALYELKVQAAARLAYLGQLHLAFVDCASAQPAALLVGFSPALGPHAFHLPVPPYTWALQLPRTNQRSRHGSGQRLARAMRHLPPRAEVIAALHALPPLPHAVAVRWRLAPPRPSWPEIEAERAGAPGGVPRRFIRRKRS